MDTVVLFLLYSLGILAISMVGAYLPRIRKLSDGQVHLLVALSAGIFVGLLFLLLIPEALEACEHGGFGMETALYALLAGFLLIMAVEVLIKHHHAGECSSECDDDEHGHSMISMSSFIGLSIHAACDGLALAATFLAGEEVAAITTVGMCVHKFVVLFSLSSILLVSDIPKRKCMWYLLGFGLITPLAGLLFFGLLSGVSDIDGLTGIPLAFAAGTFMYVALCDMLPEAFHRKGREPTSFGLVVAGILIVLAIALAFPHVHRSRHASRRRFLPPVLLYMVDMTSACKSPTCGWSSSRS